MARTILPSLPAVGLAIALLLSPLRPRLRIAVGAIAIAAPLAATIAAGGVRPKEDWNGAARILAGSAPASADLIVACPDWKAPALMSALRDSSLPPVATQVHGGIRLLELPAADRRQWARTYFDRLYLFHHYREMGRARPVENHASMPVSTVWLVESDCPEEMRAAVLAWAGPGAFTAKWQAPTTADHAGITIEAWTRRAPDPLPVGY